MWTDRACPKKVPIPEAGKLNRSGTGTRQRRSKVEGPSTFYKKGPQIATVHIKPDTPMCWVKLGDKRTYALVDSGADISLISKETFDKIPRKNIFEFSTEDCIPLHAVSGHKLENFGTVVLQVKMAKFDKLYKFQIVEGMKNQCILGNDFLSEFEAQLDFGQKTLSIEGNVIPLRPQKLTCSVVTSLVRTSQKVTIPAQSYAELPAFINREQLIDQECVVQPLNNIPILGDEPLLQVVSSVSRVNFNREVSVVIMNTSCRNYTIPSRSVIGLAEILEEPDVCISTASDCTESISPTEGSTGTRQKADLTHASEYQRQKLEELLAQNGDLFAKSDCDLGTTDLVKVKIDTGDHPPIKQNPYRLPFSQRKVVEEQIDEMLKAGIIEPSRSPWASPIVMVKKKDGTQRFCVDLRKVNKVAKSYSHPLPRIDDLLASLGGSQYFTCLDLKSGYWQIAMDEESKEKTAFTCFLGLNQFRVMPFGLNCAPSYFSELMNKVLSGIQHKFTLAYLDDIIIYSKTFDEHIEHIKAVFSRLRAAGLKLKMSKCEFLKREVNYLGHLVSASGIKPDPQKVSAIQNLGAPSTVKDVRSFIGMCSYYRRFIPNFAKIAKPLTELTKKNRRFDWSDQCQTAFETLRTTLTTAPILAYPDINKPYILYTDASDYAIGAALVQDTATGERVIQYLSHQLNETQQRWPVIEKEGYAIIYSVQKFRHYLYGSKFTVMTDHKPLKHLFTSEMRNARVQRWAIILEEYGCDVEYVSGSKNVVADCLSRLGPTVANEGASGMTSESFGGPADYAVRGQEGGGQQCSEDEEMNEVCGVNVINSDKAPAVRLESKLPTQMCEKETKEKFKEFLENHSDFQSAQAQDPEIQRLINILADSNHAMHGEISRVYVLEDGLLYRITEPDKNMNYAGMQLVIPKFFQLPVIEEVHSGYFGGHLGIDKTYDKIRTRYYWSGMYKDVVQFLKTCVACNMRKLKRRRPPLQEMQIPKYPFEQIAIDTSGPFPESYNGNRYIINVIDMFSGWPESFATRSKSAETVAKILMEHIIPRHACPRVIVSDNGTEFCNAVIDQISAFFNIKHIRTSVYHPQSNGKCERYNRVQNDMLAKLVDRFQRDWDAKIPAILSAYRTAKNESTQFSPFYVLYGRDPVLPADTLLSPKYKYQGDEYVPTMLENLHSAHHHVQYNLARSHDRNREYYDRKAKPVKIKVGDMVYFRDPSGTSQSKLGSNWQPFFRVIKALSNVTFVIKNQLSGGTKVVNAQNLRIADPFTALENLPDEPTHINSKYENRKSYIPLRVQPPRKTKLVVDYDDFSPEPVAETETEPVAAAPQGDTMENVPNVPENLPPLPSSSSESDSELDIPLSELQERLRNEKRQLDSSEEEDIRLSDLAKRLRYRKPYDPESKGPPEKRTLHHSESEPRSSDSETSSPPAKISKPSVECGSDFPDTDGRDSTGECVDVANVTNTSVDKAALLARGMDMLQALIQEIAHLPK